MDANSRDDRLTEAQEMIWALLDDQISDADFQRLETLLRDDEEIRQLYVQCVQIDVDLVSWCAGKSEESDALPPLGAPLDLRAIGGDASMSDSMV